MNGNLRQECRFQGGKLHGDYKSWWENGNIKEKGQYDSGRKVGRYEWFDHDGVTTRVGDFPAAL